VIDLFLPMSSGFIACQNLRIKAVRGKFRPPFYFSPPRGKTHELIKAMFFSLVNFNLSTSINFNFFFHELQ